MVKPEQVLFGTTVRISKFLPERGMVLAYCIAACGASVKAQADRISPVVIH